MRTLTAMICGVVLAGGAHAAPFAKGDPKAGRALHDKSCTGCHISMVAGDGSKLYTRADRKVRTAQQLTARISACNVNTSAGWFPAEEEHVGAYLNQAYYHFK